MFGRVKLAGVQCMLEICHLKEWTKVQVVRAFGDDHASIGKHHNVQPVQGFMIQKIDADVIP
ncbi:MAG: hypothetical protein P8074_28290, partial [Anaerolineales bacterium]